MSVEGFGLLQQSEMCPWLRSLTHLVPWKDKNRSAEQQINEPTVGVREVPGLSPAKISGSTMTRTRSDLHDLVQWGAQSVWGNLSQHRSASWCWFVLVSNRKKSREQVFFFFIEGGINNWCRGSKDECSVSRQRLARNSAYTWNQSVLTSAPVKPVQLSSLPQ